LLAARDWLKLAAPLALADVPTAIILLVPNECD
jgi:hypothetical protein